MNTGPNARLETNAHPPEFNPHEAPHFAPELNYGPPPGFVAHPPGSGPSGPLTEQRRLAHQTTVNPTGRVSRKRKSPPASTPHEPGFDPSADFTPAGVLDTMGTDPGQGNSPVMSNTGKPLNPGKRAEQNRKAQRAFRERRELHMKELEARSQLLDAALGSADEANRRWEECRAIVDQLRNENAGLRAEVASLRAALGNAAAAFQAQATTITNGTNSGERNPLPTSGVVNGRESSSPRESPPREPEEARGS